MKDFPVSGAKIIIRKVNDDSVQTLLRFDQYGVVFAGLDDQKTVGTQGIATLLNLIVRISPEKVQKLITGMVMPAQIICANLGALLIAVTENIFCVVNSSYQLRCVFFVFIKFAAVADMIIHSAIPLLVFCIKQNL